MYAIIIWLDKVIAIMQSCKTCVCCRCTLAVGNGHWSAMKALPREAEMEVQNSQVFFVFLLPHYFLISCMRSNVVCFLGQ